MNGMKLGCVLGLIAAVVRVKKRPNLQLSLKRTGLA